MINFNLYNDQNVMNFNLTHSLPASDGPDVAVPVNPITPAQLSWPDAGIMPKKMHTIDLTFVQ